MTDLTALPSDLPVPFDDGACRHLVGLPVPTVSLFSTDGRSVELARLAGRRVVFCYPRTGQPGSPLPTGWDLIPGARGCTPEVCGFRDYHATLLSLGVAEVFGLSTQDSEYQREVRGRLGLPFELLSDHRLALTRALNLPTFVADDVTLMKRLSLAIRDGRIEHVFYPVFPPDQHAAEVAAWLAGATQG